ncbi:MAG: LysM peptidoglycan-binding domain-containing protein [Clostridia bacterium]|nr:LysM peptidoglycan-binding domain-containing protein [Clostridia bacterium]
MKSFVTIIKEVFATLLNQDKHDLNESQLEKMEHDDSQPINEQTENIPMPQLTQDYIEQFSKYNVQQDVIDEQPEIQTLQDEDQTENIESLEDKNFEPQEVSFADIKEESTESFDYYDYVSSIGQTVGKGFLKVFSLIGFIIMLPLGKLWTLLKKLWAWMDKMFINSLRAFAKEWLYFRTEVKSAGKNIHKAFKDSPKSIGSILGHYIKKAFERHPTMFKSISNIAVPVAAAILLITTISYWKGATFALKVETNGQKLGYISDESVYLTAQELVEDRLETTAETSEVLGTPVYSIALVKPNELTDAQTISDKIVENTSNAITPACGIYIDGQFICAIKNETDAMQLFNSMLDNYQRSDENDVVGFVEDVKYVQGLYPDNIETIWDTQKLIEKLNGKKAEAVYYTIQSGDTVSGIAYANGIKTSELFAMNPTVDETIKIGQQILVSNEVNYLRIKVVKTEVVSEDLPYQTIKTDNSKLFKGTTKVKKSGVNGTAQVTQLVTYVDGVRVASEEINRVTLKDPVDELVDVGTKSTSISKGLSGGSYTVTTTSGKLVWPIIGLYRVNSPYGPRNGGFHAGIDLSGPNASGHIVVAAASGRVVASGWGGAYGNRVIIDHGDGMSTLYAHCLNGSLSVSVGEYVNAGDAIARVGSTGNSTGPHLHFEVRINGNKVNPAPYLGL